MVLFIGPFFFSLGFDRSVLERHKLKVEFMGWFLMKRSPFDISISVLFNAAAASWLEIIFGLWILSWYLKCATFKLTQADH